MDNLHMNVLVYNSLRIINCIFTYISTVVLVSFFKSFVT